MAQDDLGVAGPNTRARSLARALLGLAVLVVTGTVVLLVLDAGANSSGDIAAYVVVLLASLVFATVGALLGTRVPGNPIGWILTGVGLALGLSALFEQYGLRALFLDPGSLPAARWVASLTLSTEVLMIAPLTLIFLLFPTGSVPSRRWRPVLWVAVSVVILASIGQLLQRGFPVSGFTNSLLDSHRHVVTAFGVFPARGLYSGILGVTLVVAAATFALSLVALFIRRRGGSTEQRSQIGWLAYVGAAALALFVANFALAVVTGSEHSSRADNVVSGILFTAPFVVLFLGVPIACGISILKYHLYDLDIVVRKTVVFGLLATLFTATYAAVVVGIGALIGHRERAAHAGGRRRRGHRVPTRPSPRATIRRPARLRTARHPLRGAVGAFRPARRGVLDGGRASPDRPCPGRGHGCGARPGVAPPRRHAASRDVLARDGERRCGRRTQRRRRRAPGRRERPALVPRRAPG